VEGAGGEIRRRWETVGRLTGQGKPKVVHCHGRLKAEGICKREVPRSGGSAAIPLGGADRVLCAAIPTAGWVLVRPGQDPRRSNATLNKDRGRVTPPLSWETMGAERVIKRPKGLAAPTDRPERA
jgi:hypothetical protein